MSMLVCSNWLRASVILLLSCTPHFRRSLLLHETVIAVVSPSLVESHRRVVWFAGRAAVACDRQ